MKPFKALILTLILTIQANACVNLEGTSLDGGHRSYFGRVMRVKKLEEALAGTPQGQLAALLLHHAASTEPGFSKQEFDGVELLLEGKYPQAIELFKQLEIDFPGRYGTSANLGTAYELNGDLELALKWISEGILRNKESHQGSEWLHVAILKAKIKLRENPSYLDKTHILAIPESVSRTSVLEIDGRQFTVDQILNALQYQLEERMVFVKPLDTVVADLLFSYGRLEGKTEIAESAVKLLDLSQRYGFRDSATMSQEIDRYESAIFWRKARKASYFVLGGLAFLGFLVFAYRKKWFFLSYSALAKHKRQMKRLSRSAREES